MGVMDLHVSRWGNSLAVRIPADVARSLAVTEGSVIQAEVVGPAQLRLGTGKPFDRQAFLSRLEALHKTMPITEPVVEEMRRDARY
ncbi:MAG: AbrB/MazE/SpoVT family DNA-binding domain-containing protein [Rubrivivax sp.]